MRVIQHHACNQNREAIASILIARKVIYSISPTNKCKQEHPFFGSHDARFARPTDGVDMNAADTCGNTAMLYACSRGVLNLVGVPFLLVFTCRICSCRGAACAQSNQFLFFASSLPQVVNLKNAGSDPKAVNKAGQNALCKACNAGHFALCKKLVEWGVDANQQDKEGNTSMHYAARAAHRAVFKFLLENGGRIDIANKDGKSPYFLAQQHKDLRALVVKDEEDGGGGV